MSDLTVNRFRKARGGILRAQIARLADHLGRDIRILDVGGRPDYWRNVEPRRVAPDNEWRSIEIGGHAQRLIADLAEAFRNYAIEDFSNIVVVHIEVGNSRFESRQIGRAHV